LTDSKQNEIDRLKKELAEAKKALAKQKKESVVTLVTKQEVYPPAYYNNMRRLKLIEAENKKLHKILEFGNISTLGTLIDTYKSMSKIQLEKIAREFQLYYADPEERERLKDLINYLSYIKHEFVSFLLTKEEE
jgi:hypothetical protein